MLPGPAIMTSSMFIGAMTPRALGRARDLYRFGTTGATWLMEACQRRSYVRTMQLLFSVYQV